MCPVSNQFINTCQDGQTCLAPEKHIIYHIFCRTNNFQVSRKINKKVELVFFISVNAAKSIDYSAFNLFLL